MGVPVVEVNSVYLSIMLLIRRRVRLFFRIYFFPCQQPSIKDLSCLVSVLIHGFVLLDKQAPSEAEAECAALCKNDKVLLTKTFAFLFPLLHSIFFLYAIYFVGVRCCFRRYGFPYFWGSKVPSSFNGSKFQENTCDGI